MSKKLALRDLITLTNGWPDGTKGYVDESKMIKTLDQLGEEFGYGAMSQMAKWIADTQIWGKGKAVAKIKKQRFKAMKWKLPVSFEEVVAILEE